MTTKIGSNSSPDSIGLLPNDIHGNKVMCTVNGKGSVGLFFFSFPQVVPGGDDVFHICHSEQQRQGSKEQKSEETEKV